MVHTKLNRYQLKLWIYSYICNNIVDISGLERNVINMMDKSVTLKDTRVRFELAAPTLMKSAITE